MTLNPVLALFVRLTDGAEWGGALGLRKKEAEVDEEVCFKVD